MKYDKNIAIKNHKKSVNYFTISKKSVNYFTIWEIFITFFILKSIKFSHEKVF